MNHARSCTAFLLSLGLVGLACQSEPGAPAGEAQAGKPTEARQLYGDELESALHDADVFLLDVREPSELERFGTLSGYTNIPIGELDGRLDELPKGRPILTACQSGGRAERAAALLAENGFEVYGFCGLKDYEGERVFPKAGS